jgi:cysteinyl-tRNA synthetase
MQVMNLTDVDDKIIRKAAANGQTITQVTEPFTDLFHQDRRTCASRMPRCIPRPPSTSPR